MSQQTQIPDVFVEQNAWQKMLVVARTAKPNEVLALMLGKANKEGQLIVEDIFVPNQEVTRGHCAMKTDKLLCDFLAENTEKVIGWWHSHVDMGTFYSGEDNSTLENFGADDVMYSLGIVMTVNGAAKGWLKIRKPIELPKIEVNVKIYWETKAEITAEMEKQVKERVTEKKYPAYQYGFQGDYWPQNKADSSHQTATQTPTGKLENSDEKAIIVDLNCDWIGQGRKGLYCVIHGEFKCGTKHCQRLLKKKDIEKPNEQKTLPPPPSCFQGCAYANNPGVSNGKTGCFGLKDKDEFMSCAECELDKIQQGVP